MKSSPKILIIGSTGKLGSTLLSYCKKKNINIFAITGYKNNRKLKLQKNLYNINKTFLLSDKIEQDKFKKFLKSNLIDIVYFLDYGYNSIIYSDIFIKKK